MPFVRALFGESNAQYWAACATHSASRPSDPGSASNVFVGRDSKLTIVDVVYRRARFFVDAAVAAARCVARTGDASTRIYATVMVCMLNKGIYNRVVEGIYNRVETSGKRPPKGTSGRDRRRPSSMAHAKDSPVQ